MVLVYGTLKNYDQCQMRLWAVGLKSKLTTINHEGHHKPFYMYMNRFCDWVIIKTKHTFSFMFIYVGIYPTNLFFLGITMTGLPVLILPSLEKRFSLSSKELGIIAAANDVAALLFVVFISFYGDYGNKIKWVGRGAGVAGNVLYILYPNPILSFRHI